MAAADTVVGVVGALLLVGVMVGVFVYEYNNVPTDGDGQVPVTGLRPGDDIDGDGIPNDADDDVDGDGVPNGEDPETATHATSGGSLGPSTGDAVQNRFVQEIVAHAGATSINATVAYQVAAPAPAPRIPNFQVTLLDVDGEVVATAQAEQEGTAVAASLELVGDIPADGATYTLEVREPQGGAGGSFQIDYWVIYG